MHGDAIRISFECLVKFLESHLDLPDPPLRGAVHPGRWFENRRAVVHERQQGVCFGEVGGMAGA